MKENSALLSSFSLTGNGRSVYGNASHSLHSPNSSSSFVSSQLPLKKQSLVDKLFEQPLNPTIAKNSHLDLLRESKVVGKLSQTRHKALASIHTCQQRNPNINVFVLNEGEYDNFTYEPRKITRNYFIPNDKQQQLQQAQSQQMSGRINHHQQPTFKFQLSKKEYFNSIEQIPRANFNPFHLVPDLINEPDLVSQPANLNKRLPMIDQLSVASSQAGTRKREHSLMSSIVMNQNEMTRSDINDTEQSVIDQMQLQIETGDSEVRQSALGLRGRGESTVSNQVVTAASILKDSVMMSSKSSAHNNTFLPSLPRGQSHSSSLSNEFKLMLKKEVEQIRSQERQIHMSNLQARAHPKNFQSQSDLATLAKCLLLDANNSPSALKASLRVSLGLSADELLKVAKFSDRVFFEKIAEKDKNKVRTCENTPKEANQNQGTILFGRLSKGLIEQHDPTKTLKYSEIPSKQQESKAQISIRKQKMQRNMASSNYLATTMKAVREEDMKKKEQFGNNKSFGTDDPAFITQDKMGWEKTQQQQQQLI